MIKFNLSTLIIAMIVSATANGDEEKSLNAALTKVGLDQASSEMKLNQELVRPAEKSTYTTLVAEDKWLRMELDVRGPLDQQTAPVQIKEAVQSFSKLYSTHLTPYPGEVSKVTECPDSMKPEKTSVNFLGKPVDAYFAHANDRFIFGVCDKSQAKKFGLFMATFDEKTKNLFELRLFGARDSSDARARMKDLVAGFKSADSQK